MTYWISVHQGAACTDMFAFNGTKRSLIAHLVERKAREPYISEFAVTRERLDRTYREPYFPDYVKCPVC